MTIDSRLHEECADGVVQTAEIKIIVAGIRESYEAFGFVGECIKPLAELDRYHPVQRSAQE